MNIDKKLTVTVAINTFNRPEALSDCLDSLKNQTYKNFEVLIVNGGDSLSIDALLKKFTLPCKVVQQEKKGLVEARNLCWKESQGDIVCIIDDDLVVSNNWLEEVMKTFQLSGEIGGVTGPTLIDERRASDRDALSLINKFEKGNLFWKILGRFYLGFILEGKSKEIGRILDCGTFTLGSNYLDCLKNKDLIEVDYLEACHMCLRRELIAQVGGFDYSYTGTGEWSEPDLAFKIRKLGYKLIFNPKAISEHRISREGVFKARTYAFERSINFINFYFRHIKPNTFRKFIRFYSYLLFMNFYWVYKTLESKNINWLSGIMGSISGLSKNTIFRWQKKA